MSGLQLATVSPIELLREVGELHDVRGSMGTESARIGSAFPERRRSPITSGSGGASTRACSPSSATTRRSRRTPRALRVCEVKVNAVALALLVKPRVYPHSAFESVSGRMVRQAFDRRQFVSYRFSSERPCNRHHPLDSQQGSAEPCRETAAASISQGRCKDWPRSRLPTTSRLRLLRRFK
jgi:hypothetical protein